MRLALMIALASLFAAARPATAGVYSITDTADGYVYSGNPTTTLAAFAFGPPGLLPTSRTTVISGSTHDTESLLSFSLANLPVGITSSQITSATLTLRTADVAIYPVSHAIVPTVVQPFVVDVFASPIVWSNSTAYGALPALSTLTPVDQKSVSDTSVVSTGHLVDVTFNLTSLVKGWVDGSIPNNGLLLAGDAVVGDGTPAAIFMSRGYIDSTTFSFVGQNNGPQLTVTTVPERGSVALALMAAGGVGLARLVRRRRKS